MTNADLEKMVDTSDEWVTTRTGIKERRIAEPGDLAFELAAPAARAALKEAALEPDRIDLIICATSTPDMAFPSTACMIQRKIGATSAAAFDISAACSGFIYALKTADSFIKASAAKNVLIVTVEMMSRVVDWSDRSTCVLFGDGAAAALLSAADQGGLVDVRIAADGRYSDFLMSGYASSALAADLDPATAERVGYSGASSHLTMKGNQTFKVAIKAMTEISETILRENSLSIDDISLIAPHQANARIISAVAKNLKAPPEKIFLNLQRYGNTSATTIPCALHEASGAGRLKRGDLVLLVAFGGGFTWGAALLEW